MALLQARATGATTGGKSVTAPKAALSGVMGANGASTGARDWGAARGYHFCEPPQTAGLLTPRL